MIIGAHVMLQSGDEAADKAFFRDTLKMPNVDAGGGFLLFALPTSEIAVHEGNSAMHELYLMCDDVETFVAEMRGRDIACSAPQNRGWGIMTQMTLPGGGQLGVYQPLHKRPSAATAAASARKEGKRSARKEARKTGRKAAHRKETKRSSSGGKKGRRKSAIRTAQRKAKPRRGRTRTR